ncbi:MAG: NAD-binding protein [Planctomycetota bacterium]
MATARPVLIVGSTGVAALMAAELHQRGHRVALVSDESADSARFPESAVAIYLEGDLFEPSILCRANASEADVIVCASVSDERNLTTAILCRRAFEARRVIALVNEPWRGEAFGELGVEIICPTRLAATAILGSCGLAEGQEHESSSSEGGRP